MLWCEHCGGCIPTRRDDDCFISCSNCGKILLCQDAITGEPTFVKRPGRKSRRASSFIKSISTYYSQPFKRNLNKGNPTAAETSQEATHQILLKKHAPVSNYKNPKEINHDGTDATGQNPGTIEHESDITDNDFKLRQLGYEIVKEGSDNGGTSSYNKLQHYGKQDNVCDYSYDGDDDNDDY